MPSESPSQRSVGLPGATPDDAPGPLLAREAASLVQRLRLFTAARWAAAVAPWGSRADLVLHLAQSFADAAADAEAGPRRALPRLGSDLALPDQLAVTADDLVRAGTADLAHVAHLLAHREDLLGEPPPARLAALLSGVTDSCDRRAG